MDPELNAKEVAFNKIIQWLKEHGRASFGFFSGYGFGLLFIG
jgi:hypothetical protein